jgi:molybdopterin-guanine dinucleotide biosynthesis protein A
MQANPVVGAVIAGGRSVRFGGEKAAAPLAGVPLLIRAALRLQGVCSSVAVNARPGTEAAALATAAGLPLLPDAPGDPDGPLAGIRAGLEWARGLGARALAVSPCDAPLLPDEVFVRLIEAADAKGAWRPAMAVTSEGRQPLCSVWPVSALETVSAAIAGGRHPATWRVLEELGAVRVPIEPASAFANVNTREELAAVAAGFTSDRGLR